MGQIVIIHRPNGKQTKRENFLHVFVEIDFVFLAGCAQQPLKKQDVSANCVDFFFLASRPEQ